MVFNNSIILTWGETGHVRTATITLPITYNVVPKVICTSKFTTHGTDYTESITNITINSFSYYLDKEGGNWGSYSLMYFTIGY